MFTAKQQKQIKKVLGWGYAKKIQNALIAKGILNSRNQPYSSESIRNVFTGRVENKAIIKEIVALVEIQLKDNEELKANCDLTLKKIEL